jgi:flavin-dependent thymidylate synthase
LFSDGWHTLTAATGLRLQNGKAVWKQGDYYLYANGTEIEQPALYQDSEWLDEQESVDEFGGPTVATAQQKRSRIAPDKLSVAKLVRVERFEYVGERETYDLEVEGPFHNFVANGIVTHNSVNEYSTRYSIAIDAMQTTPADAWRTQAQQNRQGSGAPLPPEAGVQLTDSERQFQEQARALYEQRLAAGVAREQARKDLPLSTYTEAYWKIDLHNLLHFLALRMDAHAQYEIREYSRTIGEEIVSRLFPVVWEAFVDYRLHGLILTRLDIGVLQRLMALGQRRPAGLPFTEADFLEVQDESWRGLTRSL